MHQVVNRCVDVLLTQVPAVQGDVCNTCNTRLIRSFLSFEPLPLLEFQLAADVTDQQVHAPFKTCSLRTDSATSVK